MVDGEDEAKLADAANPPVWSQQSSDNSIPQPHLQDLSSNHLLSAQGSPSSQTSSRPLPPIPPRQPFIRLPLCTHSVVERQHCVNPYEQCESCGRIPFLGWFFVCVEDTSGFSDPLDPIRGPFLSPWILKAIETGQYTEEEREVLIQQKLRVLTMADLERAPSSSISMLEAEYGSGGPAMQQTGQTASSPASPGGSTADLFPHPLPPLPCILRACRHCERRFANLEERSWGSINEICNDPAIGPPAAFELAGRPVSDANIVRKLGWRSAAIPIPTVETFEDCADDSGQEGLGSVLDFQIDLTGDDLSSLALDIVGKGDIKQDESADIDSDESISSILIGVEIGDESETGGDRETYGGVSLR